MFGRKNKMTEAERVDAQQFGKRVVDAIKGDISAYCSKVIPFAASGPLRQLAHNIDDMQGDPFDDELNRRKAREVALFTANSLNYLDPLKAQLKGQISERYGEMLDAETQGLVEELIEREFNDKRWLIVESAGYVAGLSGPWIKELLGIEG